MTWAVSNNITDKCPDTLVISVTPECQPSEVPHILVEMAPCPTRGNQRPHQVPEIKLGRTNNRFIETVLQHYKYIRRLR